MHFHSPLAAAHEVRQYQVVHRDDEIALQIVLADGASPERVREQVGEALSRKLRDAGADPPPSRFKFVESIARDPRTMSRLKLVRSETSHADGG